jgi:hypothetical protein
MPGTKENNEFSKWWSHWVSMREQCQIEMQHSPTGTGPRDFAECNADEKDGKLVHEPDVAPESHVL